MIKHVRNTNVSFFLFSDNFKSLETNRFKEFLLEIPQETIVLIPKIITRIAAHLAATKSRFRKTLIIQDEEFIPNYSIVPNTSAFYLQIVNGLKKYLGQNKLDNSYINSGDDDTGSKSDVYNVIVIRI
ncbi:hypothetical protein RCL_jg1046.t1 [Rhizophagus clarus]|uniref:Uncharacterized protein n=1 Tax=Rhizophagus clarus TaxID=94130 RepID=A0A8H3M9Y8_9GLOM|nr:hypothetical protein RCL_jg1046.t1 [Rhizophagus clarus]